MSIINKGSEENLILKKCCDNHWVNIKDIEQLIEAEDEFKIKSRRRWITLRLKQIVKGIVSDEEEDK